MVFGNRKEGQTMDDPNYGFTPEEIEMVRSTIRNGEKLEMTELRKYLRYAQRSGLDPLARQIYGLATSQKIMENGHEKWVYKLSIGTTIDGFRLIADRTKLYKGQIGPLWCGEDGDWKDVWLSDKPPVAAKTAVIKQGFEEPMWATAKFSSYVQTIGRDQNVVASPMWQKMPEVMIGKVSEALALRRAFPQELSGLYTEDEIALTPSVETAASSFHPEELEEKVISRPAAKVSPRLLEVEPLPVEVAETPSRASVIKTPVPQSIESRLNPAQSAEEAPRAQQERPVLHESGGALYDDAPKGISSMVDALISNLAKVSPEQSAIDKSDFLAKVCMFVFDEIPNLKTLDRQDTMSVQRVIAKINRGEMLLEELEGWGK